MERDFEVIYHAQYDLTEYRVNGRHAFFVKGDRTK